MIVWRASGAQLLTTRTHGSAFRSAVGYRVVALPALRAKLRMDRRYRRSASGVGVCTSGAGPSQLGPLPLRGTGSGVRDGVLWGWRVGGTC